MRSPPAARLGRAAPSRAALGLLVAGLGSAGALSACGDEPLPTEPVPTADEVRTYFGLTAGSCVAYRFGAGRSPATSQVQGPDTAVVAGRTVFRRTFSLPSGGFADEQFFEPREDGELRLLRFDTSVEQSGSTERQSKRYPDDEAPLFARLGYDDDMQPRLEQGDRFEVTTTPTMQRVGEPRTERHQVVVQRTDVDVSFVPYTDASDTGVDLIYTRQVGTEAEVNTQLTVLPGRGIVQIVEGGRTYVACDLRACDAAGENCVGADACTQMSCN
jgi:hypothetical protein